MSKRDPKNNVLIVTLPLPVDYTEQEVRDILRPARRLAARAEPGVPDGVQLVHYSVEGGCTAKEFMDAAKNAPA